MRSENGLNDRNSDGDYANFRGALVQYVVAVVQVVGERAHQEVNNTAMTAVMCTCTGTTHCYYCTLLAIFFLVKYFSSICMVLVAYLKQRIGNCFTWLVIRNGSSVN